MSEIVLFTRHNDLSAAGSVLDSNLMPTNFSGYTVYKELRAHCEEECVTSGTRVPGGMEVCV